MITPNTGYIIYVNNSDVRIQLLGVEEYGAIRYNCDTEAFIDAGCVEKTSLEQAIQQAIGRIRIACSVFAHSDIGDAQDIYSTWGQAEAALRMAARWLEDMTDEIPLDNKGVKAVVSAITDFEQRLRNAFADEQYFSLWEQDKEIVSELLKENTIVEE